MTQVLEKRHWLGGGGGSVGSIAATLSVTCDQAFFFLSGKREKRTGSFPFVSQTKREEGHLIAGYSLGPPREETAGLVSGPSCPRRKFKIIFMRSHQTPEMKNVIKYQTHVVLFRICHKKSAEERTD